MKIITSLNRLTIATYLPVDFQSLIIKLIKLYYIVDYFSLLKNVLL